MNPLPEDSKSRKEYPMYRGLFCYFPKALAAVAHHSFVGGQQHGHAELHWDRNKSNDDEDALLRHILEGDWRAAAWRALAVLEKALEDEAFTDYMTDSQALEFLQKAGIADEFGNLTEPYREETTQNADNGTAPNTKDNPDAITELHGNNAKVIEQSVKSCPLSTGLHGKGSEDALSWRDRAQCGRCGGRGTWWDGDITHVRLPCPDCNVTVKS